MSAPQPATIDVIVVTWNNRDLALDCLAHVAASTVPQRTIVVDNASADDTVASIRERFPDAEVVALDENIGYGPAINAGLTRCGGEFVALVNNDANIEPDFLEKMLTCFDDPSVGMAGGVSLSPGGEIDAAGILLDHGLAGYLHLAGRPLADLDVRDARLIAPAHVHVMYRREVLDQVGGFDEEIFAYCEEVDLVMRVRAAGWDFRIDPSARSVHLGSATLGSRTLRQVELASWGRGYVAGRYRTSGFSLLLELGVGVVDALRLRSLQPVRQKVEGWRHGRALPRRPRPQGIAYVNWVDALRLRMRSF